MSFLTCSRPDPSSKMGSSAAAVSSSVCIFLPFPCLLPPPYNRPRAAPTQVTSEVMGLPGGNDGEAGSTVTPSAAASRCPISRWRGLRQMSLICCCGWCWWCPSRVSSSSRRCDPAHRRCGTRSIPPSSSGSLLRRIKQEMRDREEQPQSDPVVATLANDLPSQRPPLALTELRAELWHVRARDRQRRRVNAREAENFTRRLTC